MSTDGLLAIEAVELVRHHRSGDSSIRSLDGVSMVVAPGEVVAVIGPSGSGKSTLVHLLAGLDEPDGGVARVQGTAWRSLQGNARASFRRRTCGFVAQSLALLPQATAAENIEVPLLLDRVGADERRRRVAESLERLGLSQEAAKLPDQLSGGQQQRVVIARALVTKPAVVLADEPTASLDSVTALAVTRLLLGSAAEQALRNDPSAVLLSKELASDEGLHPGDRLNLTIFPDAEGKTRNLSLHVVGVYRTFPPTAPFSEAVAGTAVAPEAELQPADFYLARVKSGRERPAADVRVKGCDVFTPAHQPQRVRRSLASLNLGGLSRIESVGAGLIATLGLAVLGAFVVLERRREIAVLQAIGTETRQLVVQPLELGTVAVATVAIGLFLGVALAVLAARVLGLFFSVPPPLVTVPARSLLLLALGTLLGSSAALATCLIAIARLRPAEVLREL